MGKNKIWTFRGNTTYTIFSIDVEASDREEAIALFEGDFPGVDWEETTHVADTNRLTGKEREIIDHIVSAYNAYIELGEAHAYNAIQRIVKDFKPGGVFANSSDGNIIKNGDYSNIFDNIRNRNVSGFETTKTMGTVPPVNPFPVRSQMPDL